MSLFDEFTCPSKHSFYHVGIFFLLIMIFILGMIERVSKDFFYTLKRTNFGKGCIDGRSSYHMCSMSLVLIMNIPFFIEYIVYIMTNRGICLLSLVIQLSFSPTR